MRSMGRRARCNRAFVRASVVHHVARHQGDEYRFYDGPFNRCANHAIIPTHSGKNIRLLDSRRCGWMPLDPRHPATGESTCADTHKTIPFGPCGFIHTMA